MIETTNTTAKALTREEQRQLKRDVLNRIYDMYSYPDVMPDYSDAQRFYIKELVFRVAKQFNVTEF